MSARLRLVLLLALALTVSAPVKAQNFGNIPPQTVLGNSSTSQKQPAQPIPFGAVMAMPFSVEGTPGPPWPAYYQNWDGARFSVNNYPISGETGGQPGEQVNSPTALLAGINIPANAVSTPAAAGFGVWGGALSASAQLGAVGVYGFGGKTAGGVSSWGVNSVVTNCPTPSCLTKTGFDGGSSAAMWGVEVDVNVFKTPSGAAPVNLQVRGVEIVGASETSVGAGGSALGLSIRPLGLGPPVVPWSTAISLADNAATNAMSIGSLGLPGSTSGSQPICWNSYNGTTTPQSSCLSTDPGGSFKMNTAGLNLFQVDGVNTVAITNTNLFLYPLASTPSSNSLPIAFNVISNTSANLVPSVQGVANGGNADLVLNAVGGGVVLKTNGITALQTVVLPVAGTTGMSVIVNNNAGVNLVLVQLGVPDSCGVGSRCLKVPN